MTEIIRSLTVEEADITEVCNWIHSTSDRIDIGAMDSILLASTLSSVTMHYKALFKLHCLQSELDGCPA